MAYTQPRAAKGGEIGVNGLHYKGGAFLPSTDNPKRPKRVKGTGKQEVAPYEWAVPPSGFESIYHRVKALIDSEMNPVPAAIDYYQADEKMVKTYIHLYRSGFRYVAETAYMTPLENPDGEYILA